MYTLKQKEDAIKLLIQYDMSYITVVRELGFPDSTKTLKRWYEEYRNTGKLEAPYTRSSKYTEEQKRTAVNYYLEHGKCVLRACKKLGYPSHTLLDQWVKELVPDQVEHCRSKASSIKSSREHKEKAVIALCSRSTKAKEVAAEFGTTRENLYNWRRQLLKEEYAVETKKDPKVSIQDETKTKEVLLEEIRQLREEHEKLKEEVFRAKLERDIYEKAAEVIKKDQGVSLKKMSNKEKVIVIDALRDKYKLKVLLEVLEIAKSSYCYNAKAMKAPDKYLQLRAEVKQIFADSKSVYGYRRVHAVIKNQGDRISEKIIRRIMNEEDLHVIAVKKKKYNSYQGEITPAVENIVARNFHADKPNMKWLTDITEFAIQAGKVYLSPIIDCFDGLPVSWTIGISPNAELVNTMLDCAIDTLKDDEHPIVHSDRGCHYRWPGWIDRMEAAGLTRSMSKKGCSPDNSACEGFFGRLKNEMFYGRCWDGVSIYEFIEILNEYIHWYAEERIKISLGGLSPLQYRRKLGLVA
ncbi:MAG: IS3 family transposase [Eubacterium sp.]|nr:IS3 family transposase [Eubacterium sp.]